MAIWTATAYITMLFLFFGSKTCTMKSSTLQYDSLCFVSEETMNKKLFEFKHSNYTRCRSVTTQVVKSLGSHVPV